MFILLALSKRTSDFFLNHHSFHRLSSFLETVKCSCIVIICSCIPVKAFIYLHSHPVLSHSYGSYSSRAPTHTTNPSEWAPVFRPLRLEELRNQSFPPRSGSFSLDLTATSTRQGHICRFPEFTGFGSNLLDHLRETQIHQGSSSN